MGAASRAPWETPGERAELGARAWGSREPNCPGGSRGGSCAAASWLRGGPRRRLPTFKPSPHALPRRARTHTDTHSYLQAVIALISLKIMGSICNNLGRKKNATLGVSERKEGERLAGRYPPFWKALGVGGFRQEVLVWMFAVSPCSHLLLASLSQERTLSLHSM